MSILKHSLIAPTQTISWIANHIFPNFIRHQFWASALC